MGKAVSGSRLDRLTKAQAVIGELRDGGVTHRQIGRALGVSPTMVGRWAKGTFAPSAEQLAALQKLLKGG